MGAGPEGPREGKELERPGKLSQHHFLPLPPHRRPPFPLPHFVSFPSRPHTEPWGIQYGDRDLQGSRVVSPTRMSKRRVYY